MGHSVKGHNGILLPSMLIFTAWADLLFFLISVNFRICLSSRLTPFLEVPWNLKNKTNNYYWKKADAPEVQGKQHMWGYTWARSWGSPASLSVLFPQGENASPSIWRAQVEGSGTHSHHSAGSVTVQLGIIWRFVSVGWSYVRTTVHQCHHSTSCKGVRHRYTATKADTSILCCHLF